MLNVCLTFAGEECVQCTGLYEIIEQDVEINYLYVNKMFYIIFTAAYLKTYCGHHVIDLFSISVRR